MFTEIQGSHQFDPLYMLLAAEDEDEADQLAATQDAALGQHNLRAEFEHGVNYSTEPFSLDEAGQSDTTDAAIINLIASIRRTK